MKILFILLLFSFTLLGIEKGDPVMLQIVSKNIKVPSDFKDGVEEMLTFNKNSLIDEKQQEETLKIQAKQRKTDCYDNECLVDVGKMLAARGLIVVEVGKSGSSYKFKAKIIDFETGSIQRTKVLYYKGKLNDGENLNNFGKKLISELLNLKRNSKVAITENEYIESESDFNIASDNQYLVIFSSNPQKAIVLVDGSLFCKETPCSKMLNSGNHKVVIQKEKYEKLLFNLNVNKELKINKNLTYSLGYLTITSNIEGAKIRIDNKIIGTTPINNYELSKGAHKIEIDDKCFYKSIKTIGIKKGEKRVVNFNIKNRKSGVKVLVTDNKKNILKGKLYIDNKYIGGIPKTYKVPLCSKTAEIKTQKGSMKVDLKLKENKVFVLKKKIMFGNCQNGMCYIPAGEFTMGCVKEDNNCREDEKPAHKVYLDSYWIDEYEVTVVELGKCINAGVCSGSYSESYYTENNNYPAIGVNWYEANKFCKWVDKRLPTEAEWEKAARGGNDKIYPWGNDIANCDNSVMNEYNDNKTIHDGCGKYGFGVIGSKVAGKNNYGLYDMSGNVSEWVLDVYGRDYYKNSPYKNPQNKGIVNPLHVLRGGRWNEGFRYLRSSSREYTVASSKSIGLGFRCVASKDYEFSKYNKKMGIKYIVGCNYSEFKNYNVFILLFLSIVFLLIKKGYLK